MFLHYLSYAAVLSAFGFVILSLASGLLYVSELIEEYSRLAKTIGQRGIYVILILHVVLYFTESLPLGHTIFSMACHAVYLQNFSNTWPLISLTSASFMASCVMVIADHFLWFFHFARKTQETRHRNYRSPTEGTLGFTEIATFFGLCVWLAPLFLFLSLSANDNALPMSSAADSTPGATSPAIRQSKGSLFRSIFSVFDVEIPRLRRKRGLTDGIIAPRTPIVSRSPSLQSVRSASPVTVRAYDTTRSSPPRSPRMSGEFQLGSVPQRGSASIRRATRADSVEFR